MLQEARMQKPVEVKKQRIRRPPEQITELIMEAERNQNQAAICRHETTQPNLFSRWKTKFKEAGVEGKRIQASAAAALLMNLNGDALFLSEKPRLPRSRRPTAEKLHWYPLRFKIRSAESLCKLIAIYSISPPPGNNILWRGSQRLTEVQIEIEIGMKLVGS